MKKITFLVLILGLVAASCISKSKGPSILAPSALTPEENDVRAIEKFFYLNDRDMFNKASEKFSKDYPNSIYRLYTRLLISRQMFQDNQLTQALEINLAVQKEAFTVNEKIYYEAVFYSSEIYEGLGKLENSLATLVECEKNNLKLNDRIRLFELPLKMSVAYARMNQNDLSISYVKKTEQGLKEYLSKENLNKKSLSEIYYEIGVGVLAPTFMDYYTDANKFSITYKYLIYCLNLNESPYADKAKNQLVTQLKSLWAQVQAEAVPSTGDKLEDEKIRFAKLTHLSKILNSIQMLEPIGVKQLTSAEKEFFAYLEEVQKLTFNEIYAQYKYTPPTEESFRHRVFRDQMKLEDAEKKKQ